MAYVPTDLRGLARIRYNDAPSLTSRETGVVAPEPIDAASAKLAFEMAEAEKWGYTHAAWMALDSFGRMKIRALYPEGKIIETETYGRGFVTPESIVGQVIETATYGRGFVPSIIDVVTPLVHPFVPDAPTFEVDGSRIAPQPPPSILPAETRLPTVSPVISGIRGDPALAFEMVEAKKYGYTHAAWMALGWRGRSKIRADHPEGKITVTPDGVSTAVARVDIISGRDPLRSTIHEVGAGDYERGLEIANPQPTVSLVATKTGLTFADLVKVEPIRVQTAEEAIGVPDTGNLVLYGALAAGAWVLWDMFKPKRRGKRRKYTFEARKRHLRQSWQ